MPSRPQFSLRMLLFVVVMVCLAAATVSPTDYPEPGLLRLGGRTIPETMSIAAHAQGALRMAMCIALPAIFISGCASPRKHFQAFCIGALFPALAGLTIVCMRCGHYLDDQIPKFLQAYGNRGIRILLSVWWNSLPQFRYELATLWVLAAACGAATLSLDWFLAFGHKESETNGTVKRPRHFWGLGLFAAALIGLLALTLARPLRSEISRHILQLLTMTLSMTLQGLLSVGAVRSRGFTKAFCLGAALASYLCWPILCEGLAQDAANRGNPFGWPYMHVLPRRYSFAAVWVAAPIFGLACALLHWLFRLGDVRDNDGKMRVEKPG